MPADVLRLIGFHVAKDEPFHFILRSGSPEFVLRHLDHFRLVSRAFAEVGRGVMLSLFRKDVYHYHRILNLPNKMFSLPRTQQAMDGLGIHKLVDTISIHPLAVPTHDIMELEEIRNEQIECYTYGAWGHDKPDPLEMVQDELWEFLRHCAQQEQFLASSEVLDEKAALATMLSMLPRRLKLNVRVFEYWCRDVYLHSLKKKSPRAPCFHWKVLSFIVTVLRLCDIGSMTLTADSSMFHSMSIQQIRSTFMSVSSLTSLRLEMSRLDFLLDKTWMPSKHLEAAPEFNAFLACATNLEEIVLCYNDLEERDICSGEADYESQWPPPPGDGEWLALVLKGLHWPKLKKFEVHDFPVNTKMLLRFLNRHKDSLDHVTLASVTGLTTRARVHDLLGPRGCKIDFSAYPPAHGDSDDEDNNANSHDVNADAGSEELDDADYDYYGE